MGIYFDLFKNADVWLCETEAAKILGTTPGNLRLSRCTGELFKGVQAPPYIKLGGATRYSLNDLNEYMSKKTRYSSTADYKATNRE